MSAKRSVTVGALLPACALLLAGCYTNEVTAFPDGLEPWEDNRAERPTPTADDPCPETIVFLDTGFEGSRAAHARACIHEPMARVWEAVRDAQTSRDPTTTHGFRVVEYQTEPDYPWTYKTYVFVDHELTDIEFELNWRHSVVEGTEDAPLVTATRWAKTWGSSAISNMEGSIILQPLDGNEEITEVLYQYHLNSIGSSHSTIHDYLTVIYGRLRERAHGMALVPNDCADCPAAPAGYPTTPE